MRWMPLLACLMFGSTAMAEMPLPSFRQQLGLQAWFEVNAKIDKASSLLATVDAQGANGDTLAEANGLLHEAIGHAAAYQQNVAESSGLAYLQGLAWRLLKDDRKAQAAYRKSIALDPQAADAWHDLGEILIARADWRAADEAFGHVTEILDTGPQAWRGPLRQAEIAAHERDVERFEKQMREALRRGYRMQWIRDEPQWHVFFHDPALHDTVEGFVRFYGSRELALELQANPP
jgi:tetratricopeptide (TPR) repeat protein